jgi:hypothetical protein
MCSEYRNSSEKTNKGNEEKRREDFYGNLCPCYLAVPRLGETTK